MQQERKTGRIGLGWWLAPIMLLIFLEPPVLRVIGWILFEFLTPLVLLVGGAACITRMALMAVAPPQRRLQDEFADEEAARKSRIAALRSRAEKMDVTLRDLRELSLVPEQETRARWAEVDLEAALKQTRQEIAGERGSLFLLEAIRWFGQIEPLLRDLHRMDEANIGVWLGRLANIRAQGVGILSRLRADLDAVEQQPGGSAEKLLGEALVEIDALRADLVTRRAELLAGNTLRRPERPRLDALRELAPGHEPRPEIDSSLALDSLHHLRARLCRVRAQREVRSWLSD